MLLQLGGHQVLLQLLVLVLAGLELLLGTGGQQGLQGAALLVLLAGLTVLDQVVTGRRMVEAVAMAIPVAIPMAVPMAIDGTSVALQCRGGGIGLVVVVVVGGVIVSIVVYDSSSSRSSSSSRWWLPKKNIA